MAKESVGIIAPANLKFVPYVQNYINAFKQNGVEFHVMSWDKKCLQEEAANCVYQFPVKDADRKRILQGYIGFAHKCRGYIRKHKITKLVVLTAAPAFFLGVGFLRRFSGSFILDIRDESPLVKRFPKQFEKICKMAKQVIVSSESFNQWIPVKTLLCHNVDITQIEKNLDIPVKQGYRQPISIMFAGMMIESKINIRMLQAIGEDRRFQFGFVGKNIEGIMAYAKAKGLENTAFGGQYNKDDIYSIYREKADLVNIIRANTVVNRNALPNKLYDAVLAGVPVVVFSHNKAIADYVSEYYLGLVLEEDMETLGDTIAQQMQSFDYARYEKGRRDFLKKVMAEMELFMKILADFC